jgi:hypothetical protein
MRLTEKVKLVEVRFQSNADLLIPSEFSIIEKTPKASLATNNLFLFQRMEVIVQPIFGIAGFFANAFAIPVLCR